MHEASTTISNGSNANTQCAEKLIVNKECDVSVTQNGNSTFTRLPRQDPIDIQFENIICTASEGFRKGNCFFFKISLFRII